MKYPLRTDRRPGVSLVELIVLMSAASVILSLSAGLIHRMMHAESRARSVAAVERTSLRLAEALRRDIHAASSAVTDPSQLTDGAFLRLESAEKGRIDYRLEDLTIHRLQLDAEQIVAREQFLFPTDIELKILPEGSRLLVLILTSSKRSVDEPEDPVRLAHALPVDLQIIAALQRGAQ